MPHFHNKQRKKLASPKATVALRYIVDVGRLSSRHWTVE